MTRDEARRRHLHDEQQKVWERFFAAVDAADKAWDSAQDILALQARLVRATRDDALFEARRDRTEALAELRRMFNEEAGR